MAFRNTAAELTRQYKQNRNDIEALHDLLKKTDKRVAATETKVDKLSEDVSHLKTNVVQLTARVDRLDTKVDRLDTKIEEFGSRFDERFDRLEQLIALPSGDRAPSSPQDALRTSQEKKLGVLEMKVDIYNRRTSEHIDELARHNKIFDAYDERFAAQDRRFDALDGQMAEVLSILRSKPA